MISSASNSQQYAHVGSTSSASHVAASGTTSASSPSALSTPTAGDRLEEGTSGFRNAWLRQLDQERHVQGTGAVSAQQRVESLQEASHAQTVANLLAQERLRRV